jgi:hypothetical protein
MGFGQLDFWEGILVIALLSMFGWELWQGLRSRQWVAVYRPTLFVAVILAYYVVVGPLRAIANEATLYRGLDLRGVLLWGWGATLVFYASLLLGFYASPKSQAPRKLIFHSDPAHLHRLGLRLCQLGLLMFGLVTGTRLIAILNPFAVGLLTRGGFSQRGLDVGAIANYFNYAVNFLIPGTCLMMAASLRQRRHTFTLILWLLAAAGIYTSLGFRYRLVLLAVPVLLLWFMARRKRPSLAVLAAFVAAFITLNGFLGYTRSYGGGLNLTRIEGQTAGDFFDAGFSEATVFFTTAGVIEQTPSRAPHIGAAPFVATLLFPIPRALFPDKPDASYLNDATSQLYGGEIFAVGSFILNVGEYYLIAGWPSLIALSALLGWLLRRLWNWFLFRQNEPFAQTIYTLSACYLYMVISRGYLPQVVMLFTFSVAPLFWLYGRWAQPVARRALPSPSPLPLR